MRFTLRQLELFTALSEHSTLSAAAAALNISESGLSHAVSELERAVGETLCLRRRAKGYALTPAGVHFGERARLLLRDADELGNSLANRRGELRGPVTMGCFTGLAPTVLPPLFQAFPQEHPGVELGLTLGGHDELLERLEEGELDLAFLYDIDLPGGLDLRPLYPTEVVVVLAEDHPLAAHEAVQLEALVEEPLIMLEASPSAAHTQRVFRERGLTPNVFTSVPSVELVRALVGRGLGYSLLMARPLWSHVTEEGRRIVDRPLAPRAGVTTTVAAWRVDHPITPRALAVVDHAVQQLR